VTAAAGLDGEASSFLRRSRIALFASRSPRGAAFLTPLWFVERAGRLYCTTSAGSLTVRNVEANGDAALLLYPGEARREDRALRLRGAATVRRGRLPVATLLAMARKYYAAPGGLSVELANIRLWPLRLRYYGQAGPALLEFTPATAEWLRVPS
jgi:hypothetical protein